MSDNLAIVMQVGTCEGAAPGMLEFTTKVKLAISYLTKTLALLPFVFK